MLQPIRFNTCKQKGFTLVELLVVLSIFIIIIGVVVSIFISIINIQRAVLQEQEYVDQVSYAIESISKTLRISLVDPTGVCLYDGESSYGGYVYLLTDYNETDGYYQGIKFIASDGSCRQFVFNPESGLYSSIDGFSAQNILSDKFIIKDFKVVIDGDKTKVGAIATALVQPRVTILTKIQINTSQGPKEKVLQTTVSRIILNQ